MTNEGNAWYNAKGPENDVVVSTRLRLARNLVSFPFPSQFSHDDGMRVQSLVFDAFSKMEYPDQYQSLSVNKLDQMGQKILLERGALSAEYLQSPVSGIVVRTDGRLSCTINVDDHIHIAAFCSGFDTHYVYSLAQQVDNSLQNVLQIAASIEFGYLTCKMENVGTGIKLSIYAHLPSLAHAYGDSQSLFSLFYELESQGFSVVPVFGLSLNDTNILSAAVGDCYQISSTVCLNGTEEDQMNSFQLMAKKVIRLERLQRELLCDTQPTLLRDTVYKALAKVKYSRVLTEKEALDLLFRLKWGKDTNILSGIDDSQLSSLLYRIREGHISFINQSERFKYEKDINTTEKKIQRLRSLIMQESVENIQIFS